jgi:hypothetical protein
LGICHGHFAVPNAKVELRGTATLKAVYLCPLKRMLGPPNPVVGRAPMMRARKYLHHGLDLAMDDCEWKSSQGAIGLSELLWP